MQKLFCLHVFWKSHCTRHPCRYANIIFGMSSHTLSATSLQTLPFTFKVVLIAQTPSILEEHTVHRGGVVVVTLVHPETRSCVRFCFTGLCGKRAGEANGESEFLSFYTFISYENVQLAICVSWSLTSSIEQRWIITRALHICRSQRRHRVSPHTLYHKDTQPQSEIKTAARTTNKIRYNLLPCMNSFYSCYSLQQHCDRIQITYFFLIIYGLKVNLWSILP